MTNSDNAPAHAADRPSVAGSRPYRLPLPLVVFAAMVLVAAAVLLAAMPARAQSETAPGEVEINRIILRVNDQILTLHEYEGRKNGMIERILANPNLDPQVRQEQLSVLGKQIAKASFDEMLLMSRAKQMSIIVSEDQITATINQVRSNQDLASDEAFEQALRASKMTMAQLREDYRREMTMRELVNREVQDRVDLSEDALRAFYRENPDRFQVPERRRLEEVIVFSASGLDAAQMTQVAEEILAAARGGATLAAASESYREQGIASEVVDLGWLDAGEIGEELRAVAFAATPDSYAGPIEARGGLHLLHVVEVQPGALRGFSEVQDELRQEVRERGFGREMQGYMAELEDHAFIRENLPAEAVGFRALRQSGEVQRDALDVFRAQDLPAAPVDEKQKGKGAGAR